MIFSTIAQVGSLGIPTARYCGVGSCATAYNSGVYAIGTNPANLSLDTSKFQVTPFVPGLGIKLTNSYFSINEYAKYFRPCNESPKTLSVQDKADILQIFSDRSSFFILSNSVYFSMVYYPSDKIGAFGLSLSDYVALNAAIPSDLMDLVLFGNKVGSTYSFSDLNIQSWYLRSLNFSYSREFEIKKSKILKSANVGIGLKYVWGFAYAGIDYALGTLTTGKFNELTGRADARANVAVSDDFGYYYTIDSTSQNRQIKWNSRNGSASAFPKPAGSGYGVDVGLTLNFVNSLRISMAITDIGKIKWTENAASMSVFW